MTQCFILDYTSCWNALYRKRDTYLWVIVLMTNRAVLVAKLRTNVHSKNRSYVVLLFALSGLHGYCSTMFNSSFVIVIWVENCMLHRKQCEKIKDNFINLYVMSMLKQSDVGNKRECSIIICLKRKYSFPIILLMARTYICICVCILDDSIWRYILVKYFT